MYSKIARFYDTLYASKDYSGGAAFLHQLIQTRTPGALSLLEIACGTGRYLEHFGKWYQVEGVDINAELLTFAARRCAGVPLHHCNAIDLNLGRQFQVVLCLFAIAYLLTRENLVTAVKRMAAHLRPGGLLVIEPAYTPDQYWRDALTVNCSSRDSQKLAWMYVNSQRGSRADIDVHYMAGEGQTIEYFTERHEFALYTPNDFSGAFRNANLTWTFEEPTPQFRCGLYVATHGNTVDL